MKIYQCQIIHQDVRKYFNFLNIVKLTHKIKLKSEYINVFCRFRPPNDLELASSTNNSVILLSPKNLIITQDKNLEIKKDYTFDGLFEIDTSKEIFYERTCKPIIDKFLEGYNGSIICYGETGTGKTYTINEIIPQVITQIFENINETDSENELFKIDVSIIEIFKEQVNDLLDIKNKNLNLVNNKQNQLIIDNLTHIGVSSDEQLTQAIKQGISKRNNNSPKMKDYNSKSHFIIILTLFHYYKNKNCMKISKLFLVDLEGSERLSYKPKLDEEPLEEQKLINKSLIALSIIVQNLSNKNDNINYAPYRDSKLTRIISDSFGGNCYTTLILNCSKHEYSTIETRNTLMFGEKAKKIRNTPMINIEYNINKYNNNAYSEIFQNENDDKEKYIPSNYNKSKNMSSNHKNKNRNNNNNINLSINNINNSNINNSNINNSNLNNSNINNSNVTGGDDNELHIKDIIKTEVKFLKMQIKQLKEKIEQDNTEIEQLNERNAILENEKKNLMNEFENIINKKRKEDKEDKLNSEYIKNNISDLHELLNEKEKNEQKLKDDIYSLKLILEKKNNELSDIVNQKNREIKKIKDEQNDEIKSTFEELTECLEQAANQITDKDKKIEELLNEINSFQNSKDNNIKEISDLKIYINQLEQERGSEMGKEKDKEKGKGKKVEKRNLINNKEDNNKNDFVNISENNEDNNNINNINDNLDMDIMNKNIKSLNDKIIELSNELNNKENYINELNEEKMAFLKKKGDYENRIKGMTILINKMKTELDNKNISLDDNDNKIILLQNELISLNQNNNEANNSLNKLISENNMLKAKIKLLEDNYNTASIKNNDLINQINILQKENYEKFNKINSENMSKINELQNELNESECSKNKDSLALHNLKLKNQKLINKISLLEEENKKLMEYQNLNNNLRNEIILKNKNIEEYIDNINSNNNIISSLKKDIITKNKFIEEQNKNYQELEKENNNINILKKNIDKANNMINELLKKNENLSKENNENKNIINKLKHDIDMKKIEMEQNKIEYQNNLKEYENNKNLVIQLKKEISTVNNTIIDYKSKINEMEFKQNEAKSKIDNLQNELMSKDYIINDFKIKNEQIMAENSKNKNIIKDLENKNNSILNNFNMLKNDYNILKKNNDENIRKNNELINNIEIIKETHIREINKYKEIIKQKELEISSLNKEYINSKQNLEKILELQRKLSELKIENNQLYLKLQDYDNIKHQYELMSNNQKNTDLNYSFKENSKDKIKSAYQSLIQENEQLKDNIIELRKYHQ